MNHCVHSQGARHREEHLADGARPAAVLIPEELVYVKALRAAKRLVAYLTLQTTTRGHVFSQVAVEYESLLTEGAGGNSLPMLCLHV
jgi:hypothetical protein